MVKTDFHIHTNIRPWDDGRDELSVEAIINYAAARGYSAVGLSPHIHTGCDIEALATALKQKIQLVEAGIDCYCATEVECVDIDGTLTVSPQQSQLFDYIVASADHFNCRGAYKPPKDMKLMLEAHQKLLMQLAANPIVNVISHPWIALILLTCEGHLPGYDIIQDLSAVPESWYYELAQAAAESGTAIEINGFYAGKYLQQRQAAGNSYEKQYFRFFEIMAGEGVLISPNSDAHSLAELAQADDARDWVRRLGLPDSRIWQPKKKIS